MVFHFFHQDLRRKQLSTKNEFFILAFVYCKFSTNSHANWSFLFSFSLKTAANGRLNCSLERKTVFFFKNEYISKGSHVKQIIPTDESWRASPFLTIKAIKNLPLSLKIIQILLIDVKSRPLSKIQAKIRVTNQFINNSNVANL